jgi:hypothetical protein
VNGGIAVGTGNGVPRPPASRLPVRDGTVVVDRPGAVVLGCSRVCVVGFPMPAGDPPELQDARATATTTSTI